MVDAKSITVSCACGAATHTFAVPTSHLPLSTNLCSCDISRRISGSLLTSYVSITFPNVLSDTPTPKLGSLTAYDSSSILRRHFCSTCGTHMYLEYHADGSFWAATGTLTEEKTDDLISFESCMWIGDTKDGGASQFITEIEGKKLKRWKEEANASDEVPLDWKDESIPPAISNSTNQEPIHAHCHCRGVEFWVKPPSLSSDSNTASPFPDLMVPYSSTQSAENPDNHPWWLQTSSNTTKFLAGTCTCTSCRKVSGFDITFWAFIPTSHIFLSKDLSIPFPAPSSSFDDLQNATWGTMKTYTSSPGVTRSFCARCGANVLWAGSKETHGREGLVDVAIGLLDARSGARAEEVLEWWTERVSFREQAVNRGLVEGLEMGLREWREGRRFE